MRNFRCDGQPRNKDRARYGYPFRFGTRFMTEGNWYRYLGPENEDATAFLWHVRAVREGGDGADQEVLCLCNRTIWLAFGQSELFQADR